MQACVDILNAKRIPVNGTSLDTVETLKEKISKETGLSPCLQTLHVLQNGATVEWKDDSSIYFGDLLKKKAVIYLSSKRGNSSSSYYINIVTETGRVLLVTPEGGKAATINDLKQQLSIILDQRADSLFLRIVELSKRINRPLGELFNTLEDYGVISGSVLYVQIHPWSESWFHGKIGRDQAEEIMSSASEGQFLVKESVSFPGDYVLFVRDAGQVKHFKVSCHKNMMFTINGRNFFYTIAEMIQFYKRKEGLPIKGKLKEPVTRSELSECTGGEGLTTTGSSSVRPRLYTAASTEIHIRVVIGSKTFSLLTSTLNQVQSLKAQIEEKSGQPADCQLLRLNDKLLVMDSFHLSDYHVMENSTIYVQVHPWDEDWYVGDLTHDKIDSLVKSMSTVPKDGMFLIKDSSTSPGNYCLYVWWKGNPVRYLVEFKKNRFAIGNEHQFNSLSDLVEWYRKCRGGLKSQLTDPVKIDKDSKCRFPPAVVARGNKAKAAYRRALENGKTRDVRVRIMLIGEDKAGKTSLKRFLKGEKFNKHEASTLGVDMDAPLLKDGLKAWSAHKTVKNISVFDHRSAQLVVRQLSEPNGYPTSDLAKAKYPVRKGFSCSEANCSERKCYLNLPSASNGVSNGIEHCKDMHHFNERLKGMPNGTDHYEGPPSPFLQDDVFTSDQVISDPLPRNMASLVEDILTSDQDPSDNLPQNVANLVERMLRQEHFSASEEVWPVIWDFSGQSLLHGMNPIFMSREAVYLLVCDLTKDLFSKKHTGQSARATNMQHKTDSCFDHLVRWMDLVHSFQDTSAASVTSSAQPPVILVGTHADKVSGDPWNRLEAILDSFHGKQFSSHIVDKFSVDNTRAGQAKEDPTILKLRQKIISVASSLPHTNREIPLQWLRVEKVLHRLAAEGFKYITLQQFKTVAKRVCRFHVDEDSDELLHFLCDCGAVLCFNETDESNCLVFLDPQWLVRLFCQIINVVSGRREPMNIRQCRQTLAKKGILSEELVNFACQESDLNLSKESLLSVMEKASLVCRLEVQNGEVVYLVPSMLPATPENEISGLIDQYMIAPVYITFNTGYIPYGLFSRFVVLFSDWASKEHSARAPKMSANTARFFIGKKNDYSLTFAFFKSVVMVHVLREGSKEEETEMTAICQQVYRCIEDILHSLHLRCHWLHSITWKLCARCDLCLGEREGDDGCSWHHIPSCLHPDCAHFIPLGPDRPLRCEQTIKARTLLDEDKLKPWIKHFGRNRAAADLCFKPGVVSPDDLLYLAHDVGLQWKSLCRILLGAKEVEHIDHDQRTLDDKCYTMLDRWKKSQASDATYAALGMALMHEDLQAEELCAKYCLHCNKVKNPSQKDRRVLCSTVTSEGGVLAGKSVQLVFPPKAVGSSLTVYVTLEDPSKYYGQFVLRDLENDVMFGTPIISLEPSGHLFKKPLTLIITFNMNFDWNDVLILHGSKSGGEKITWYDVTHNSKIDEANTEVIIEIEHFSIIAILCRLSRTTLRCTRDILSRLNLVAFNYTLSVLLKKSNTLVHDELALLFVSQDVYHEQFYKEDETSSALVQLKEDGFVELHVHCSQEEKSIYNSETLQVDVHLEGDYKLADSTHESTSFTVHCYDWWREGKVIRIPLEWDKDVRSLCGKVSVRGEYGHTSERHFNEQDLCCYVRSLLRVEGAIFNVIPIAKLLEMPEESMSHLTKSREDENEQLEMILLRWSQKKNTVDLASLRKDLESLKQEDYMVTPRGQMHIRHLRKVSAKILGSQDMDTHLRNHFIRKIQNLCKSLFRDCCIEMEVSSDNVERAASYTNHAQYLIQSIENHCPLPPEIKRKYQEVCSLFGESTIYNFLIIVPYLIQNVKDIFVGDKMSEVPQNGLKGLPKETLDQFVSRVRNAEGENGFFDLMCHSCNILYRLCVENYGKAPNTEIEEWRESMAILSMLSYLKPFFQHCFQDIRLHKRLELLSCRLTETLAARYCIDEDFVHDSSNVLMSLIDFAKFDPSKVVRFDIQGSTDVPFSCPRETVRYDNLENTYSQVICIKKETEEELLLHVTARVYIDGEISRKGTFQSTIMLTLSSEKALDEFITSFLDVKATKLEDKDAGYLRVVFCSSQKERLLELMDVLRKKLRENVVDFKGSEIKLCPLSMRSIVTSKVDAVRSLRLVYKWGSEAVFLDSNDFVAYARSCYDQCVGNIEIFIQMMDGRMITIAVNPNDYVRNVKKDIHQFYQYPPNRQRLVFNGRRLEDHCRLSDYNIRNGTTLHLVQRFRAWNPHLHWGGLI